MKMEVFVKLRSCLTIPRQHCRYVSFFSRKKKPPVEAQESESSVRKPLPGHDKMSKEALNLVAAKASLTTKRGYDPPSDVEAKIEVIVKKAVPNIQGDWQTVSLKDPLIKFKIASKAVSEFNHNLPNHDLTQAATVADLVSYFSAPVRQTSAFEDLSKLDLPPNLHIIQEYTRFDPETDTMFGGKSAYPGQDTVVSSIKYKRKYKSIKNSKEKAGYVDFYNLGY